MAKLCQKHIAKPEKNKMQINLKKIHVSKSYIHSFTVICVIHLWRRNVPSENIHFFQLWKIWMNEWMCTFWTYTLIIWIKCLCFNIKCITYLDTKLYTINNSFEISGICIFFCVEWMIIHGALKVVARFWQGGIVKVFYRA